MKPTDHPAAELLRITDEHLVYCKARMRVWFWFAMLGINIAALNAWFYLHPTRHWLCYLNLAAFTFGLHGVTQNVSRFYFWFRRYCLNRRLRFYILLTERAMVKLDKAAVLRYKQKMDNILERLYV